MYALLVSWTGDIGAYYVGRSFGRHRLAPRISPHKSWEGAIASVATALLLAGAYLVYFVGVPIPLALALTAVANAAGQLGDLAESAIKRGAGVKDSGATPARPRRLLRPRGQHPVHAAGDLRLRPLRRQVTSEPRPQSRDREGAGR